MMKKFLMIALPVVAVLLVGWFVYSALRFPIAERRWKQANVQNYEITVHEESAWHSQTYIVVVKNGRVVNADFYCSNSAIGGEFEECVVQPFDPAAYTVEGLFEKAKRVSSAEIEFDARYHFPRYIFDGGPFGSHDAWWVLEVKSFTAMPSP
jgi:Family of unknown function (DUF6174)